MPNLLSLRCFEIGEYDIFSDFVAVGLGLGNIQLVPRIIVILQIG